MAENMWGKQPPSGKSNPPPDPAVPSFWGPAPVPPKVYTFWDDIFGEGRDAEEYVPPEGVEPEMFHDSWVGGYRRGATNGPLPWGESPPESEHEQPEGKDPLGVHDSWVGGDRIGAENDSFMNTGEGYGTEDTEGNEIDPEHDSWVGGNRIGAENDSFMNTGGEDDPPDQEGNNIDPKGNKLIGGESLDLGGHDSWVGGNRIGAENDSFTNTSEGYGTEDTEGNEIDPKHDSWVGGDRIGAKNGPLPWGTGRPSEHEGPSGIEPIMLHSSWLGGYNRGATNGPLPWGTWTEKEALQGNEGEVEERDAEAPEEGGSKINPEGSSLYKRDSDKPLGLHNSWVKHFNIGAESGSTPFGEGKDGSYTPPPFKNPTNDFTPFTPPSPPSAKPVQIDPFVGQWNFRVEIDGIPANNCKLLSVSGITTETEPIQYKFSTDAHMQSIPGRYKFSDVELTKVYRVGGDDFYMWRETIENGTDDLRTVTIHLHHIDIDAGPVMTMVLHDAYPVKWEFPELNGSSSDAAVEKITLCVTKVTRGFNPEAIMKRAQMMSKLR